MHISLKPAIPGKGKGNKQKTCCYSKDGMSKEQPRVGVSKYIVMNVSHPPLGQ